MSWFKREVEVKTVTERVEVKVEVERLVPVGDAVVDVFTVESKAYKRDMESYWGASYSWDPYADAAYPGPKPKKPGKPEWSGRVYRTCAQAFAEIGADADLTPCKALIVGDKAYLLTDLAERPLAPKPKVAKGKGRS